MKFDLPVRLTPTKPAYELFRMVGRNRAPISPEGAIGAMNGPFSSSIRCNEARRPAVAGRDPPRRLPRTKSGHVHETQPGPIAIANRIGHTHPQIEYPPLNQQVSVLVMDEDDMVRRLFRDVLEPMGCVVKLAADGQEAVALYDRAMHTRRPFDLVFLDLTVRVGMGAVAALKVLRTLNGAVKAIVMSGYSHNTVIEEYSLYGFKNALRKPFKLRTLRGVFSRALGC